GLTGFSYAELAAAIPRAGAEYVYLARALPRRRWAGFLTGFLTIVSGITTVATVSLAFGGYATLFVDLPVMASAAILILVCTLLNIGGIRESSWVNIVLTSIEVLGLLLVITLGVQAEFPPEGFLEVTPAVLGGAAIIFFVYTGFEDLANLSEEAREPGRDLPRALFICLAITTVLYVLVALSALALVPADQLAASDSPLALAAGQVSPRYAAALGYIALVSTANTGLIAAIATSRMIYGMAKGGEFPPALARTLPVRQTPWMAALVVFVGGALFLPLGTVAAVASVSSFAALLAFVAVNLAAILLRYSEPGLERPFRIPWTIRRVPVPSALGILATLALVIQFDRNVY
ncbi:MAG TPA: APC family permease, partial [bacterium]|nr:APC family permease [bacterium]